MNFSAAGNAACVFFFSACRVFEGGAGGKVVFKWRYEECGRCEELFRLRYGNENGVFAADLRVRSQGDGKLANLSG